MKGIDKMKKPEAKDIFFESMFLQENVWSVILLVSLVIVVASALILLTAIKGVNSVKQEEKEFKETKIFLYVVIAFFLLTTLISLCGNWQIAKGLTKEENKNFLLIESNNRWFSEQVETIYLDLEPKEYEIYKIISIKKTEITKDAYLEKVKLKNVKEEVVINYIEDLEKGMLFKIKALIVNDKKEIEEISFLANLKVEEKEQVEKAFLYHINDNDKDIGPNIMFGEVKINKNE
jgi:hypothetical protein